MQLPIVLCFRHAVLSVFRAVCFACSKCEQDSCRQPVGEGMRKSRHSGAAVAVFLSVLKCLCDDFSAGLAAAADGTRDHVELLFARELDEVHSVTRNADGELRVLLGVFHCIVEEIAVEDVHVEVLTTRSGVK